MKDEKMDLSVLDPARDAERWNSLVESVARKAWNSRRQQLTVSFQIVSWARPALAIAASLALVSWAATWAQARTGASSAYTDGVTGVTGVTRDRKDQDPTTLLAQWAEADELPPTLEILRVLGARNGTD